MSGLVLFVFALAVAWQASKLPFGTINAPDSGFLPLSFAVVLALLSGLIVVRSWLRAILVTAMPAWKGFGRVAMAAAALVAYAAVVDRAGYLLATGLVMLVLLRGVERIGWRTSVTIAIISVVASHLLFRELGVPLPQGILPF